jgi:hypothetical protein
LGGEPNIYSETRSSCGKRFGLGPPLKMRRLRSTRLQLVAWTGREPAAKPASFVTANSRRRAMKKYIAVLVAAAALAAALVVPAGASAAAKNPYEAVTSSGNNPVFYQSACSSVRNSNNINQGFGANGGINIPGVPQTDTTIGEVIAGEAVVSSYTSSCGEGEAGFVGTPAFYE